LPEIIQRRQALRTQRIWSAGCASGEEPYSIALLLRDLLPDVDEWSITIMGTDVNSAALDRARRAQYGEWAFREERAKQWRARFFTCEDNRFQLKPEVQRMVSFGRLNLAEAAFPSYDTNTMFLDMILCRNVTIYFTEAVTRQVIGQFYQALVEDGWLVVGHSEHSLGTYQRFQVHNFPDAILYQRVAQPTSSQPDWDWAARARQEYPMDRPATKKAAARPVEPVLSRPAQAAPALPAARKVSPAEQPKPDEVLARARDLIDGGRSEQARDLLMPLVERKSAYTETFTLLGQAHANLGNWQEAEQWCNRAIRSNKLAREAYYILSLVHQHQGHLSEAIEAMKKVVYIDQNSVLGHFGLADLYFNNRQLPNALKSLDNARRLLANLPGEEVIPNSGGITAARLLEAVTRRQQQWSVQAAGLAQNSKNKAF
jgi:chemotaxis protein methyltransferase CheR